MQINITKSVADKAKPQGKPYQIHDAIIKGFILRVQPTGRRMWKLIIDRKPITLGEYPIMSAAMARAKAMRVLNGEDEQPVQVVTLSQFIEEYYREFAESHHSRPKETLSHLGRFGLDDRPLDQIHIADIEKWRNARLREGLNSKTINRVVAGLKSALQKAVDWELIGEHPLSRIKPLKIDKRGVIRYLEGDESKRLMSALESAKPWLKTLVTVALNTGLRRGELWNLSWGDIDLKKQMLVVRGAGAKSGQTRFIPLNGSAVVALKQWRGDVVRMKSLPVFGRHEFKKSWATVLRNAGITGFRFHDCRHTFASRLVSAGVPLNHVRELMGHSSLEMTLIYAHLAPRELANAVELIG